MRTIYRFVIPVDDRHHDIYISSKSRPLQVQNVSASSVEFWCEVETSETYLRRFTVIGTGQNVPEGSVVHGTAPRNHAGLVWHLVEIPIVHPTHNPHNPAHSALPIDAAPA